MMPVGILLIILGIAMLAGNDPTDVQIVPFEEPKGNGQQQDDEQEEEEQKRKQEFPKKPFSIIATGLRYNGAKEDDEDLNTYRHWSMTSIDSRWRPVLV